MVLLLKSVVLVIFVSTSCCWALATVSQKNDIEYPFINLQDDTIIVESVNGLIKGRILQSVSGHRFAAFQGIRYGRAERFELATKVSNWTDEFDATQDGPVCPQSKGNYANMSEDCLHLNIYVKLDALLDRIKRPVVVYIHGGGFVEGSNTFDHDVGPQYLMDYNVVFVAINYRLNIFGFISTGTAEAPGNLGLKDQALAFKWIATNIKFFKGNDRAMTLMGENAGSMAASLHLVSPLMTKTMFERVILMSGSAVAQWKLPNDLFNLTKQTANLVGCPENNIPRMLNCLKRVPLETLALIYLELKEWDEYPSLTWIPVIEPSFGQEQFLIEDPLITYRRGEFAKVKVLMGVTKDEWAYPINKFLRNRHLLQELDYKFEEKAPICFLYERGTVKSMLISQELRNATFGDRRIDEESIQELHLLFSESIITFGVFRVALLLSINDEDIFFYRFSYKKRFSHMYNDDGTPYGAVHADDLLYLFVMNDKAPIFTPVDPEWNMVHYLTRMWVNFVRYGNPVPDDDPVVGHIVWLPFQPNNKVSYYSVAI